MGATSEKISDQLKAWRNRNGWKQWRAAALIGVPVGTYRNWELGKAEPRGLAREVVLARVTATDGAVATL